MTNVIAPPQTAIAGVQDLLALLRNAEEAQALVDALAKATAEYQAAKDAVVLERNQAASDVEAHEQARLAAEKTADKAEKAQAKAEQAKADAAAERAELAALKEQLETERVTLATSQKAFDLLVRDKGVETDAALAAAKAANDEAEKLRAALAAKLAVLQEPV